MEPYLGTIQAFPYGYAPYGWALCDGSPHRIIENQALFALIGFKFGGDGQSTFNYPNLTGASPDPNMQYYIAVMGLFPPRQ